MYHTRVSQITPSTSGSSSDSSSSDSSSSSSSGSGATTSHVVTAINSLTGEMVQCECDHLVIATDPETALALCKTGAAPTSYIQLIFMYSVNIYALIFPCTYVTHLTHLSSYLPFQSSHMLIYPLYNPPLPSNHPQHSLPTRHSSFSPVQKGGTVQPPRALVPALSIPPGRGSICVYYGFDGPPPVDSPVLVLNGRCCVIHTSFYMILMILLTCTCLIFTHYTP